MRLFINKSGVRLKTINISFFGYGSEEFEKEVLSSLEKGYEGFYHVINTREFYRKIQGRISKKNTGLLFHYVLALDCDLSVYSGW